MGRRSGCCEDPRGVPSGWRAAGARAQVREAAQAADSARGQSLPDLQPPSVPGSGETRTAARRSLVTLPEAVRLGRQGRDLVGKEVLPRGWAGAHKGGRPPPRRTNTARSWERPSTSKPRDERVRAAWLGRGLRRGSGVHSVLVSRSPQQGAPHGHAADYGVACPQGADRVSLWPCRGLPGGRWPHDRTARLLLGSGFPGL